MLKMLQIWAPELDYLILDKYTSSTFIHAIKQQFRKDYSGEWSKSCSFFLIQLRVAVIYVIRSRKNYYKIS